MNRLEIKYDIELDLKSNNSLKLINDRVRDNTKILEFGPANGRFTKHLCENRNCIVDIVEYNEISGQEAARYARTALLGKDKGDIEKYIWTEELAGEKYDFIIFADVLEHLYNPEEVLKRCRNFLQADGVILISVPNIANNNIIINLLSDEFNYTPTGLLDDTHIRFFTYKSVYGIAERLHYGVSNIDYVVGRVNETEVRVNPPVDSNLSAVYEHQIGNVFQWIVELNLDCGKKACLKTFPIKYIPSGYFSLNGEYSEETRVFHKKINCCDDIYEVVFSLLSCKLENRFRFDPLEGVACRLEILQAKTDSEQCKIVNSNAIYESNGIMYFLTNDPIVEMSFTNNNVDNVSIRYRLQALSVEMLINELMEANAICQRIEAEMKRIKSNKGLA